MTSDETKNLTHIVGRYAELNREIQERKWEQKELADSAWEKTGVKPKVVRQLAKEQAWDAVKREEQRQYEEALDECRSKLGMLADTPLGQAEIERVEAEEPQHHLSNSKYKAPRKNNRSKRVVEAAVN